MNLKWDGESRSLSALQLSSRRVYRFAEKTVVTLAGFCPRAAGARNDSRMEHCSPGFTLMETLMTVAIAIVLTTVAIPAYSSYREKMRTHQAIVEIRAMEADINTWDPLTGGLPPSLADIGWDLHRDPWGNPYRYLRIQDSDEAMGAGHGLGKQRRDRNQKPVNTDYDLYSMGKDGETVTQFNGRKAWDDIVRANNGEYVGLASEH